MDMRNILDDILAERGADRTFAPSLHYDADGDCLEFFVANDAFLGQRVDKWVTVYRSRKDGRVIGSLIKNVKELLKRNPGLAIDVECGPVCLSHFLQASAFTATSKPTYMIYKEILVEAERANLKAELAPC